MEILIVDGVAHDYFIVDAMLTGCVSRPFLVPRAEYSIIPVLDPFGCELAEGRNGVEDALGGMNSPKKDELGNLRRSLSQYCRETGIHPQIGHEDPVSIHPYDIHQLAAREM